MRAQLVSTLPDFPITHVQLALPWTKGSVFSTIETPYGEVTYQKLLGVSTIYIVETSQGLEAYQVKH